MAVSRIQFADNRGTNQTSLTATWGSTTTTGSTLLAFVGVADPSGSAPTFSTPTGWGSAILSEVSNAPAPSYKVYQIDNSSARSGGETFAFNPGAQDAFVTLVEVGGTASTALDKTQTSFNVSSVTTLPTGATATTAQAAEYWVGVCVNRNSGSVPASPTDSFANFVATSTTNSTAGNAIGYALADKVVAATGTASLSWSVGSARPYAAAVLTLKQAAGVAPTNTVAPVVSGTATVGQALATTDGTWTGDATITYTYQWQRDNAGGGSFSNIGSATASTYTLVDADDGNKVRCVVTATNGAGNAAANSNAVGLVIEPVPTNSVAPAVTGTASVGSLLTTDNGTWTHMGGSIHTYAYKWQRDVAGNGSFSDIGSATSSTYTLVDADDGNKVRAVVTATNSGGAGSGANSNQTSLVVEAGVPVNTVAPAVTGSTTVGSTLTTDNGTWTGLGGITHTYTYKWQRDSQGSGGYSDIASATASTYVLVAADNACHVRSVVTATNDVGAGSPANSNAVLDTTPVASTVQAYDPSTLWTLLG